MGKLYDTDIIAWSLEQAALLRRGRWAELDLDNLVEEILDVARSEQRELQSRYAVLVSHLLKWTYQPGRRCRSWAASIDVQRASIARLLKQTTSLRRSLDDADWLAEAWSRAVLMAIDETGLPDIPPEAIWRAGEILDPAFMPA